MSYYQQMKKQLEESRKLSEQFQKAWKEHEAKAKAERREAVAIKAIKIEYIEDKTIKRIRPKTIEKARELTKDTMKTAESVHVYIETDEGHTHYYWFSKSKKWDQIKFY